LKERKAAEALFVTPDGLITALATTLSTTVSTQSSKALVTTDEPKALATSGKAGRLMTDEEKARVRAAIRAATSAEEIQKLERSLREGWVPSVSAVGA
jgi:U2 small nuclear ribonucleoprotein A'